MSENDSRSWKPVVATLAAIFLLAGAYISAWVYTIRYAGLTASRTSPAPFVVVERQSGTLQGLEGNKLVLLPFHRFVVFLWCGGAEVEVTSHMDYR
jgi:hypothetical protein